MAQLSSEGKGLSRGSTTTGKWRLSLNWQTQSSVNTGNKSHETAAIRTAVMALKQASKQISVDPQICGRALTPDSSLLRDQRWSENAPPPESADTSINLREKDGRRKREKKKGWRQVWHVCTVPGSPKLPSLISGCGSRWDTEALSVEKPQIPVPRKRTDANSRVSWDHLAFFSPSPFLVPRGDEREKAQSHTWAPRCAGSQARTLGRSSPIPLRPFFTTPLRCDLLKLPSSAVVSRLHSLGAGSCWSF